MKNAAENIFLNVWTKENIKGFGKPKIMSSLFLEVLQDLFYFFLLHYDKIVLWLLKCIYHISLQELSRHCVYSVKNEWSVIIQQY